MRRRRPAPTGFTIVELLVVLAALGVLLAIAAPQYTRHVQQSREVALKHNLRVVREAIDRFSADRGRYPKELQELVAARYLRDVPVDPITDRADTWVLVQNSAGNAGSAGSAGGTSGVFDLRSGAKGAAQDGTAYETW
jgi:general secretion pathway protein G